MIRDSSEYVKFTLADRDGSNLAGDTVQVALVAHRTDTPTWLACTQISDSEWRTSSVITFSAVNYPSSRYSVLAKVADSPETPIALLGTLTIQ